MPFSELAASSDSPALHLRSSSSALHNYAQQSAYTPPVDTSSLLWDDWMQHGMSPEIRHASTSSLGHRFGNPLDENAFAELESFSSNTEAVQYLNAGSDMNSDRETSLDHSTGQDGRDILSRREGGSATKRARTRLQSRTTKSPPPELSFQHASTSSTIQSRSYQQQLPEQFSYATNPSSLSHFPTFPSPFRQNSMAHPATMDPAHSVRSSSPSESGSIGIKLGTSSATSSVYGGEGGTVSEFGSIYRSPLASSIKSRRLGLSTSRSSSISPKKYKRPGKLTDSERKKICQHREAFPETRQDTIGDRFGVERSTISKILKNKARWLAVMSDNEEQEEDDEGNAPLVSPLPIGKAGSSDLAFPADSQMVNLTRVRGGRYPDLDEKLCDWARAHLESGAVLVDDLLFSTAKELARSIKGCDNFKASPAWLERFKQRAGITSGTSIAPAVNRIVQRPDSEMGVREEEDGVSELGHDLFKDSKRRKRQLPVMDQGSPSVSMSIDGLYTSPHATRMTPDHRTPSRTRSDEMETTPTHLRQAPAASGTFSRTRTSGDANSILDLQSEVATSTFARRTPPSRRSGQSHPSLPPLSLSTYDPAEGAAFNYNQSPFNGSGSSSSYSFQEPSYPLQSPFQAGYPAASVSGSLSGTNSPGGSSQLNRSGSITSVTSSYSSLNAAFPQNGPGTPHTGPMYGAFSNGQLSSSGSLPSTPATGYFGHGPDRTQSQLQAVFQQQTSNNLPPPQNGLIRRATITGVAPSFTSNPTSARRAPQTRSAHNNHLRQSSVVSFDQAYTSLQTALEYLSTEGNGYVSPADLIVLSDLRGKMAVSANSSPAPTPQTGRTLCNANGTLPTRAPASPSKMGTRGSGNPETLLAAMDYPGR